MQQTSKSPPSPSFQRKARRPLPAAGALVTLDPPTEEVPFLATLRATQPGVRLAAWLSGNRDAITQALQTHGAVHMTGFGIDTPAALRELASALGREVMRYDYASTPRTHLEDGVYTSTEYPPEQDIPMHNEMSYADHWPMQIWLCCVQCAHRGGRSPFADSAAVYDRLPADLRQRFEAHGVLYRRNFNTGLDLSWQKAFSTEDRAGVEARFAGSDARLEWLDGDRLRIDQVRPASMAHPETGRIVWFNQAHLFHRSALPADIRAHLDMLAPGDAPREALFGDGSPIADADLDIIREAFAAQTRSLALQPGDLVLADNMRVAHGREAFEGPRRVIVTMSERCAA